MRGSAVGDMEFTLEDFKRYIAGLRKHPRGIRIADHRKTRSNRILERSFSKQVAYPPPEGTFIPQNPNNLVCVAVTVEQLKKKSSREFIISRSQSRRIYPSVTIWGFGNNGTKSPVKPLVQPRKCRLRFGTGVSRNEVHVIFEIATSSAFCPALGAANRRVHAVCPERSGRKG
jgi:hypothetical protein